MSFSRLAGLVGRSPVLHCFGPEEDRMTMSSLQTFKLVAVAAVAAAAGGGKGLLPSTNDAGHVSQSAVCTISHFR